ncbi:Cytidylate kinase [bioreactor metagenome]|uniref:(d)CMP kinase n=1 Tax=bioreactor metagenome TaxID=1076179 RepID=A0A645CVJ2_9ZZZZ
MEQKNKKIIIAIDGPAGSGKTSSAKLLAEKLNYIYIDTGAMYRAVTLAWLRTKSELTDEVLQSIMRNIKIELMPSENGQITMLDGVDVSDEIRSSEVNSFVSPISANEFVRNNLVAMQRTLGSGRGCVMDGRDIGTTVFPDAELKMFLIASIDARAKRRLLEYENKGITNLSLDDILQQIVDRDQIDSNRAISPLRKAEDAIEIDTSNITLSEQVELMYEIALKTINRNE